MSKIVIMNIATHLVDTSFPPSRLEKMIEEFEIICHSYFYTIIEYLILAGKFDWRRELASILFIVEAMLIVACLA